MCVLSMFGYFSFVVGFECEPVEAGIHQHSLGHDCDACEAVTMRVLSVFWCFCFVVEVKCETVEVGIHQHGNDSVVFIRSCLLPFFCFIRFNVYALRNFDEMVRIPRRLLDSVLKWYSRVDPFPCTHVVLACFLSLVSNGVSYLNR